MRSFSFRTPWNHLDELADRFGSDKGGQIRAFKEELRSHSYTKIYAKLFDELPQVDSVVEVGIAGGASLRMWAEYFPGAKIIGLDIDHSSLFTEGPIQSIWVDQLDTLSLKSAVKKLRGLGVAPFSVVIDDGLHTADAAINTFENFWPELAHGGCYVIEDVSDTEIFSIVAWLRNKSLDFDVWTASVPDRREDWFLICLTKN